MANPSTIAYEALQGVMEDFKLNDNYEEANELSARNFGVFFGNIKSAHLFNLMVAPPYLDSRHNPVAFKESNLSFYTGDGRLINDALFVFSEINKTVLIEHKKIAIFAEYQLEDEKALRFYVNNTELTMSVIEIDYKNSACKNLFGEPEFMNILTFKLEDNQGPLVHWMLNLAFVPEEVREHNVHRTYLPFQ